MAYALEKLLLAGKRVELERTGKKNWRPTVGKCLPTAWT
jgi:hypothetical protein